jgi:hypothetical protein
MGFAQGLAAGRIDALLLSKLSGAASRATRRMVGKVFLMN